MLNIYEEIKIILLRKGLSLRKLSAKMQEQGYDVPVPDAISAPFRRKRVRFEMVQEAPFRRKRVRFEMVQEILDFLGYEIVIREKQK